MLLGIIEPVLEKDKKIWLGKLFFGMSGIRS